MSIRIMSLAWECDLSSTDKIVLLALADWSNDDGICWPSIAQLQAKSGLSERGVRVAIGRLKDAGHLKRVEVSGKGVTYTIHPKNAETPAGNAPGTKCPRQEMPPAPDAETPARGAPNTPVYTNTPQKTSSSSVARANPKIKTRRLRMPDDWRPVRFADDTVAREIIDRRGRDWARAALESFRNWAANADDRVGRKADWQKAWINWVIEQDRRDGRQRGSIERMAGNRGSSGHGRTVDAALDWVNGA